MVSTEETRMTAYWTYNAPCQGRVHGAKKMKYILLPYRIRRPSRILRQTLCVFHYSASIGGVRRSAYTRMLGVQRIDRGVPVSRVGVGLEGSSPMVPV